MIRIQISASGEYTIAIYSLYKNAEPGAGFFRHVMWVTPAPLAVKVYAGDKTVVF
jgi:hypothetical protein